MESIALNWFTLVVTKPPANAGDVKDVGSIPGSGRSPGGRHGSSLQYFDLENSMDCIVRILYPAV